MNDQMKRLTLGVLGAVVGFAAAGCAGGSQHRATTSAKPKVPVPGSNPTPLVVAVGTHEMPGIVLRHGAPLQSSPRGGAQFVSPTRLAIVTWGSGNCPEVPKRLVVANPSSIRIRLGLRKPANGICLADLRSIPEVIAINPKQIDVHSRLAIRLYAAPRTKPVLRFAPPLQS